MEALVALLGDDDVERWLGSLDVDPVLDSASRLAELGEWLHRASAGATRNRWLTVLRRNQRGEPIAFRFNAALKRIDHPAAHDVVAVDIPRQLDRVDAAEPAAIMSAIRDLEGQLGQSIVRASEISEPSRLSVTFVTDDGKAVAKIVDRWSAAHRGIWAEARIVEAPEWFTFGHGADDTETEEPVAFTTPRASTPLERRARWIERHPWRLISGPLLAGAAAIALGAAIPDLATTASVLFIVAFGVGAIAVGVYLLAQQYLLMREHPALGCLWLIVHGWWGIVMLGVGLFALLVAVLWFQYGGG